MRAVASSCAHTRRSFRLAKDVLGLTAAMAVLGSAANRGPPDRARLTAGEDLADEQLPQQAGRVAAHEFASPGSPVSRAQIDREVAITKT
jgi:hypothetical protein